MLARLALRIAVVEALAPSGATVFPTIAQKRVFDSRVDHLDGLDEIDARPLLVITTDDEGSELYGTAPSNPDDHTVTLSIEALVATRGTLQIPAASGAGQIDIGTVDAGPTDAEREAILDMLEAQVRRALDRRTGVASATLLDYVVVELRHIESTPFRDPDRTVRLSARDLKFRVRIYSDQWPLPGSAAGAGLAALPLPLAGLAAVLPAASPYTPILASLAAAMAPPPPSPGSGPAVIHIDAGMNRLPTSDTDADIVARQNL